MNDLHELLKRVAAAVCADAAAALPRAVAEFLVQDTVVLWASELGACTGCDPAMPRDVALARVWRRTKPAHFQSAAGMHAIATATAASTAAPASCTHEEEDVQSLYKERGIAEEHRVAELFATAIQQAVVSSKDVVVWDSVTDTATVRKPATVPGPYNIVGKLDGLLMAPPYQGAIVEIKVRMDRVSPMLIPAKDLLQVQAYLHMHDTNSCMYVQNQYGTDTLYTQQVYRDEAYWRYTVRPQLDRFVCDVRTLLAEADAELRHRVLSAHAQTCLRKPARKAGSVGFKRQSEREAEREAGCAPEREAGRAPERESGRESERGPEREPERESEADRAAPQATLPTVAPPTAPHTVALPTAPPAAARRRSYGSPLQRRKVNRTCHEVKAEVPRPLSPIVFPEQKRRRRVHAQERSNYYTRSSKTACSP